ncbi:MAG: hypothetical protein JXR96_00830 [Deltaproteobacteria bacterium]|nr:hypothetical protein [Deltaproteobacteria bacterium]
MAFAIWIGVGALIAAVIVWRLFVPSLDRIIDAAIREGDLAPILSAIARKSESAQPAAYNHAIRRLWDGFQRKEAAELLRHMVRDFGTAPIAQYWLKQVMTVEPSIARNQLGKKFYETYYLPDLAAQCGPVG